MSLADDLRSACPGLKTQELLSRHTSWAIGGPADYYADVNTILELRALHKIVSAQHIPIFFLGAGSNLLVSDRGIRGLVIHLQGNFRNVEFKNSHVTAHAGILMPTLARQAAGHGLSGIESLIGVPGTLGGGLVMNAGTREGYLGSVVDSVRVIGEGQKLEKISAQECGFSYRHSNLEGKWIVDADLVLKSDEPASIMKRIDALLAYRTRTQPLATANCGSVFKNPSEGSAAQWIEKAGFKGTNIGGARVSERHANFIINENGAKASDVKTLIQKIQEKVQKEFQVKLEPEVKMVGDW